MKIYILSQQTAIMFFYHIFENRPSPAKNLVTWIPQQIYIRLVVQVKFKPL